MLGTWFLWFWGPESGLWNTLKKPWLQYVREIIQLFPDYMSQTSKLSPLKNILGMVGMIKTLKYTVVGKF